jgi:hypothetical protein
MLNPPRFRLQFLSTENDKGHWVEKFIIEVKSISISTTKP